MRRLILLGLILFGTATDSMPLLAQGNLVVNGGLEFGCMPLSAQSNLVVNGGFEFGFTGWLGTYGYMPAPDIALEGTTVGIVIDVGSSSIGQPLHQPVPTAPGASYTFCFSLLSGYGRTGEFSPGTAPVNVYWGDQFLGVFRNPSTNIWQPYHFRVTAISDSTTITFRDDNDHHWQLIDDVRVVPVPEPSVVWFVAVCLVGLCLARKRYLPNLTTGYTPPAAASR